MQEIYKKIDAKLQAECLRMGDRIPYTAQNGHYVTDKGKEKLPFGGPMGSGRGCCGRCIRAAKERSIRRPLRRARW